ncbi:MAG: 50S ribosomal protein L20 [Candidatus Parcubacteria bacterium]|nr:50S ribosomal protein L20 [Candidatus Parcubacteria bacterium]
MVRVKRGTSAHKRRKNLLEQTKGFRWGRKNRYTLAKEALFHALTYAYRDRKARKGEKRELWQTQINAGSRKQNVPYSKLMGAMKKKNIAIDRKILALLAQEQPKIFEKIIEEAMATEKK